jgi:hypothetical protein
MSDTTQDFYQYADRAQTALLSMVRDILREAAENGLAGNHQFYLTYHTRANGVEMSDKLRASHPQEITIVLQNQYKDLTVNDDDFEVTLSFNNEPERLRIPFSALSKFYDPSVAFGLMFDADEPEDTGFAESEDALINEIFEAGALAGETDADTPSENAPETGEVVSLDSFRDK